ncbi:MAG: hypothetical protein V4676_02140 [Bacteroidota bacterium]
MSDLKTKKAELETMLAEPDTYSNPESFKKTEAAYKDVDQKLKPATAAYESLLERIMELEEELGG